jgi:hypothetical protein
MKNKKFPTQKGIMSNTQRYKQKLIEKCISFLLVLSITFITYKVGKDVLKEHNTTFEQIETRC